MNIIVDMWPVTTIFEVQYVASVACPEAYVFLPLMKVHAHKKDKSVFKCTQQYAFIEF